MSKFLESFLIFQILLAFAAGGGPTLLAASSAAKQVSPWPSLLEVLNQPGRKTSPHKFEDVLNTDLMALYKSEMKAIEESWTQESSSRKPLQSSEARQATNEYFHRRVQELNAKSFASFGTEASAHKPASKRLSDLAVKILSEVKSNPVAKLEAAQAYDPSGQVGFCFGRALLVHHSLLKAGMKPNQISKIFVSGQLRVEHRMWNFHVAVVAGDEEEGFLVIDPLFAKPMTLHDWKNLTAAYDIKGRLSRARFYFADARKFLPSSGAYSLELLRNQYLKSYFDDLGRSISEGTP